ncbi:hypothetical protein [Tropicimonas sp.]|uniref:hypothetical protein n=1 Tax=Tropicimonas sp. TaxID=2067044 RepID=UPI003A8B37A2
MAGVPAVFDRLLLLTGRLNYVWTNTESVLIHVMAGLLGTDKERAVVVFLTLNTTRARIDLVERLAKLDTCPEPARDAILDCTQRLVRLSHVRNRYNHCIYSFDTESGSARTILMRIADRKTDIRLGRSDAIDDDEVQKIEETIDRLAAINADLWALIKRFAYPV